MLELLLFGVGHLQTIGVGGRGGGGWQLNEDFLLQRITNSIELILLQCNSFACWSVSIMLPGVYLGLQRCGYNFLLFACSIEIITR